MSQFDDIISAADPGFFDVFGDDAIFDGSVPCRVIEDAETVWLETEESSSSRIEVTLSFLLSEVSPERGKLVSIGANTYRLGKQVYNDGSIARHLVEK